MNVTPTAPAARRILFVDDDPYMLRAIGRLLRRHTDWVLQFADGGHDALAAMERETVDVVISDVCMPGMDGVALMEQVRDRFPDVVRVLMSGAAEGPTRMRSVPVAYQFLEKPAAPGDLVAVVRRALGVREFLSDVRIRRLLGRVGSLPPVPRVYARLCTVVEDPLTSLDDVSEVVASDPAICARLLHIAGTAFFGRRRSVCDAQSAVRVLGAELVRELVLVAEVFDAARQVQLPPGFDLEREQQHAVSVANAARVVAGAERGAAAYTAGLLHDVGRLLLATTLTTAWAEAERVARIERRELHEVEREQLGTDHAQVGAFLLGLWGIPIEIVNAVAQHHDPTGAAAIDPVARSVYIGHLLAKQSAPGAVEQVLASLAPDALQALPMWRRSLRFE